MRKILVLAVLLFLAAPGAVVAQQSETPEGAMLIILDASGSMNNVDEDGVPFIDKAKDAIRQLVDALPDGMQVGLRVYGHREPNTDPVRGCQDTELVVPVAPLDRAAIHGALDGLDASGFTPIGLSLQEGDADLPEVSPKSIVLISDGEDTCAPPDPCQVAEELFGDLLDVRIESVGFLIDTGSAAEQQLRCIAEVTGGQYTSVGNANELVARLGEVTEGILDWRPPMTLNGALEQAAAPLIPLTAKSDWVTDEPGKIAVRRFSGILMPGETRWYRLDLWERESVWVWSDLEWPPDLAAGGHFETQIVDADGNRVEVGVGHGEYPLRTALPASESPMTGASIEDPGHGRSAQGSYLIGFQWDAPPEVFLGSLQVSVEVVNGDAARYLARTELEGAFDPANAPALVLADMADNGPDWKGGEFRGPLAAGETRWYRLDMDPGEVMNAFALFPGDRYVGEGTEGQFSIVLTDVEGNPVGSAFNEYPQMMQAFGVDHPQATVSGTTSLDADSVPETVLVGFRWDGPPGQKSEIRFEAETVFDQHRKDMAEQLQDDSNRDAPETTEPSQTASEPEADAAAGEAESALEEHAENSDSLLPVLILVAIAVVGGAAALWFFKGRRAT